MSIVPFDPAAAAAAELDDYALVTMASGAADRPGDAAWTRESVIGQLTAPPPPQVRMSYWTARDGRRIVGTAMLAMMDGENPGLAVIDITVRPDCRRRGFGTALLRELAAGAAAAGRTTVLLNEVDEGSAGQGWADAHGFAVVQRTICLGLDLATADRSSWPAGVSAGYRLAQWPGTVPDEFLASYAAAKKAMRDAPMGDIEFDLPDWTPDRVRAEEDSFRAAGGHLLVTVAISQAAVAGLTEIVVRQGRPDIASQRDTTVVPAHRGHGLGLAVKSANLRWLTASYPAVSRVRTSVAAENEHMLRVNQRLGFTVDRATQVRQMPLADLIARLGGR